MHGGHCADGGLGIRVAALYRGDNAYNILPQLFPGGEERRRPADHGGGDYILSGIYGSVSAVGVRGAYVRDSRLCGACLPHGEFPVYVLGNNRVLHDIPAGSAGKAEYAGE